MKITKTKKRAYILIATILLYVASVNIAGFITRPKTASLLAFKEIITQMSKEYKVSPALIAGMIKAESDFRPNIVSNRGAVGLMQVLPSTARELKVSNIHNPVQNIRAGTKYIKSMLVQFKGSWRLAIAAYNAGPGAVKKYGTIPPYPETKKYVQKVLKNAQNYKSHFAM